MSLQATTKRGAPDTGTDQRGGDGSCSLMSISAGEPPCQILVYAGDRLGQSALRNGLGTSYISCIHEL